MELDHYQFLQSLAEEYYTRCEAFDLQVCSGPLTYDGIMPGNAQELIIINRHARDVLTEIKQRTDDHVGLRAAMKKVNSK